MKNAENFGNEPSPGRRALKWLDSYNDYNYDENPLDSERKPTLNEPEIKPYEFSFNLRDPILSQDTAVKTN